MKQVSIVGSEVRSLRKDQAPLRWSWCPEDNSWWAGRGEASAFAAGRRGSFSARGCRDE